MKEFFKFMFASFLGTLLTLFIIFIIFFGMFAGIVALAESEQVDIDENTILHINWTTPIKDRVADNPLESFNFATMESDKPLGLNEILKNIEKASKDDDIAGILLDMESIIAGSSTIEEIRNKLLEFKESGKFIISYANNYNQKGYYLASLADEIYLNPEGMMLFKGLHVQAMFLKNMLDKLEIEMQVVRGPNNKYKSAVEPLMLDKMSEANREQLQTLIDSMWGKILLAISKSRGISVEDLNLTADNLDVADPEKALALNFVDGLLYRDELIKKLKERMNVSGDDDLESVSFGKYMSVKPKEKTKMSKNRLAVIYAEGDIIQGKSVQGSIGAETMSRAIRKAREDEKVKAIVFRVNSPGGDALASDVIRREVELAGQEKPIIVSMGNVAASGGYWISTNADYIFAQPTTVTGSIGVFGVIPNFKELFNNKLGINFEDVMTNENSDFIDVMKPMSEFQHAKLDEFIVKIYEDFVNLVATTRDLDPDYVDGIAKGRIWTGADAKELGLVDEMGGLEDAIAYAAGKAELADDYRIKEYPIQKPFFEQIVEEITGQTRARIMDEELGSFKNYFDQVKSLQQMKGVQARLPFIYSIN